jgi:hypothetical protein
MVNSKYWGKVAAYRNLPEKITFSGRMVVDNFPLTNSENANTIEEFAYSLRGIGGDAYMWIGSTHNGSKIFAYYGENVKENN